MDKMTRIGYPFIDTCIDERISFLCTRAEEKYSAIIDIGGGYEGNKNRNQN